MILSGAAAPTIDAATTGAVVVASGKLEGRFRAGALFHIDEFWMHVNDGTEFNRWLSQGLDHEVVVRLAAGAATSGDEPNARVLSGTLSHQMAPKPTSIDSDVVGPWRSSAPSRAAASPSSSRSTNENRPICRDHEAAKYTKTHEEDRL